MRDLNDLYLFVEVVHHGGFSAASRALDVPKSRLSRRIAALEERLDVRLLQRSERSFAVTSAGRLFYQHCVEMIGKAEAAENALAEIRAKPRGLVRISCPVTMAQYVLAPILPPYLAANEEVEIAVSFTNRDVNVIDEDCDVAFFIHRAPLRSKLVVARQIGWSQQVLVTSPRLFERSSRPLNPEELRALPSLSAGRGTGSDEWVLVGPDHEKTSLPLSPRLVSESLVLLKQAALDAIGVARLPALICKAELANGSLEIVLPRWSVPSHQVHLVYPTRKGMTPAIRGFVDYVIRAAGERLGG